MNTNLNKQIPFGWCSFDYHTHKFLTQKAVKAVKENKLDTSNVLTASNIGLLARFSERPDVDEIGYLQDDHFSDYKTGRTYFYRKDGAIEHFVRHGLKAVEAFKEHKEKKAIKEMGRACHFLEDIGQPYHTTTTTFFEALRKKNIHLEFEKHAARLQDTFEYFTPPKLDLQQQKPLKDFLYSLAFATAAQSAPYREDLDTRNIDKWNEISQKMLNFSQQMATLFLARILKETEQLNKQTGMIFNSLNPHERTYSEKDLQKLQDKVRKASIYADNYFVPNGVIVSDIDETILDNKGYYQSHETFSDQTWEKWVDKAVAGPIEPTVEFLKWAKKRGYKVFLLTGRKAHTQQGTVKNLEKLGIPYDRLYLKPDTYNRDSAEDYKVESRKLIEQEGFEIVVNIGDQHSDLDGGHGKKFKLPNPIYFIP